MIFICAILTIFTSTIVFAQDDYKFIKCADFPQSICGTYAKCFDDENDPKVQEFGGPYCKCDADTYEKPSNCNSYCSEACKSDKYCDITEKECKNGCKSDDTCMLDEYCCMSTRVGKKGCRSDDRCTVNHKQYCSCFEGTSPTKGIGCTIANDPKDSNWKECEAYCGENSSCEVKDNNLYCYCAHDLDKNPFIKCSPDTDAEKPTDEFMISASCIARLCVG
ncbi:unnamed protein product [Chironomus riparius]|uniref:Uncharacterized protein n=1 Tax=Chironomus riparius TaxID=315576 RepID=A0A9N9WWL7_9DIPT|nr:unnamed protein product [Chironomus riparius]